MDSISCVGSTISTSNFTVTENESYIQTPLQRCSYLRNKLGLDQYKLNGNRLTESIPHVKISSKTLRECFILPAGEKCIEEVFEKLADFLSYCKTNRVKPIRTDFTCLSRLDRDKLFIDVDCMVCKTGEPPGKCYHFSQTKSIDTIISTVCEVFNTAVSEGIYMTKGGTCGYHLFFNGLTFNETASKPVLMDALDNAFREAGLNRKAAIDRGCTQMPLPTACHSNSLKSTVPYEFIKDESGWKKKTLDWREMDAEKLKCFSNIAFSNRFEALKENVSVEKKTFLYNRPKEKDFKETDSLLHVGTSVGRKRRILGVEVKEDDGKTDSMASKKMRLLHTGAINPLLNLQEASNSPPPLPTPSSPQPPLPPILTPPPSTNTPKVSEQSVSPSFTQNQDRPPPPLQAIISMNDISKQTPESWQQLGEGDNDVASVISQHTEATEDNSFICPSNSSKIIQDHHGTHKTVCLTPSDNGNDVGSVFSTHSEADYSFICPPNVVSSKATRDHRPKRLGPPSCEDKNEVASEISVYNEANEEDSFVCPNIRKPPQSGTLPKTGKLGRPSNALDSLPYNCGHDKQSLFADKQYKAAFLSVEEDEASKSKVRLTLENKEKERVFYVPGNSTQLPREYRLLVQLTNVNRSIYGGDVIKRQEWINLMVSYYDQHLQNPVVLEILRFVFSDKDVEALFDSRTEVNEIKQSIIYVMAAFKRRNDMDAARMSDLLDTDEHEDREDRSHKSRIVSAMIRVCTHHFGMVTAVFSDLRKVQQLMERKDLSLLNRTVVNDKTITGAPEIVTRTTIDSDDDLDCSASMIGGDRGMNANNTIRLKSASNYILLASLIAHEQKNISDQALYAFLYYYHFFPLITIDRILEEVHHDGLMVSALIKYFMIYGHSGKPMTLQDIFEGFNDAIIALTGPEQFIKMKSKNKKSSNLKKQNNSNSRSANNNNAITRRMSSNNEQDDLSNTSDRLEEDITAGSDIVTKEEVDKLMCGPERRRRRLMCKSHSLDDTTGEQRVVYEWKDKHLWQAIINYYLRPVVMHEDRLVFANDSYDTFEDDAVESCFAHVMTKNKITKADVTTAFKEARTVWRMHHGSQLVYENDLRSDKMGCCFHINIALKMYEMFCGGCVTRMKRVHKNYLIDRSRFNMSVYDVVAECRTATVNLSSAIDRSYMNLLLHQPVIPPFLEDVETRQLFLSEEEIQRGSFCCLSVMDYIRTLNLFERANCQTKPELENCDYIEKFLDDLYTNEIAAELPPDIGADGKMRLLYTFYSLYLFECIFAMRHAYMVRENCNISVERLCYELDVRELLVLFFGVSSMEKVKGIDAELEQKIYQTTKRCMTNFTLKSDEDTSTADCRFDVRPVLAAEIPDKVQRMKTLFGQFGFDIMQEGSGSNNNTTTTTTNNNNNFTTDQLINPFSMENGLNCEDLNENCHINRQWEDESKFEQMFYECENWLETVCKRIQNNNIIGKSSTYQTPILSNSSTSCEGMFLRETVRSVMRLELKKHIDHDRLGKLRHATREIGSCNSMFSTMKHLPMRLKLLAFILTVHTFKLKTRLLAPDFIEETYHNDDGLFTNEYCNDEGEKENPPEKVWCLTTEALLNDRRSLLLHARWLAKQRFKSSFFVGLDPARVYSALYDYMRENEEKYPAFKRYKDNENTTSATLNLCTAMMYILIMSAYDQEHLDLYLKVFLAVEWPGQWAKTIFVWKSNSNAGKSYLFDSIIKRACANSTCINDPKGGKENAPEKAEYVKNFVLFANEFSQANSNELKKIVSESTFKFRMNYGNTMNEAYATGKIMFNCNTLPPTSDEAAINRLTLFNIPFWFCKRQRISDAMLNWICGLNMSKPSRWVMAYRYQLPSLLTEAEKIFFKSHSETKNETDLLDEYAAIRPNFYSTEFNKSTSLLFLVQNKISRLYAASSPPTDRIVHGLVNITNHFSWLRFFKRLDTPVDFTTLPASSEAIRSEWLSLTLPYQEWKTLTGAKTDPSGRVPAETINRSLQAFSVKKNINYFGIKQFFETDFASSREAIKDEYYMRFDSKVFND